MKPLDVTLAIAVAVTWGLTFVVSRLALYELSPALMTALRFTVAAIPCLFLRKPAVSWPVLILTSATLFFCQFLAQSYGLAHNIPVGLVGVVVQSQALFTVIFAAVVFRERPTRPQTAGIAVAMAGLLMICGTVGYDFSVGVFAVLMVSPIGFAIGNLLLRRTRDVPMFDLFAWLSLIPPLPLLLIAIAQDGASQTWRQLSQMSLSTMLCMVWIGTVSTGLAYWVWGRLLRDYTTAQVVPFALLVPFVSALGACIVFGERFGSLRMAGMLTVVAGIAIMLLFGRAKPAAQPA